MPVTSSTARHCMGSSGFALAEMTLALVILALLAALALPHVSGTPGPSRVRATALDVAALLKSDRNMAISRGMPVMTRIDPADRAVRSDVGGIRLAAPRGIELVLSTARAAETSGIVFYPGGASSGGIIIVKSEAAVYTIQISALTGYIAVSAAMELSP